MASAPNGQQDVAQAAVAMTAGVVAAFAPHLSEQEAVSIATAVLSQQDALGQVMHDAIDADARAKHPAWGFRLHNRAGSVKEPAGLVRVPKSAPECANLSEVMHYATTIALLTSPTARGVLSAYGYDLEFLQGGKPKPQG